MFYPFFKLPHHFIAPKSVRFFHRLRRVLPFSFRRRHMYINWMTWSWKSELLKVLLYDLWYRTTKLSSNTASIILIDPHGDISQELLHLDLAHTFKDRLVYVDPLVKDFQPVLNPLFSFSKPTIQEVIIRTEQLVTAFDETVWDAKLSIFMKALLTPVLSTLLREQTASIADIITFLDERANHLRLQKWSRNPIASHREFFESQTFNDTRFKVTKWSVMARIQSLLNYPNLHAFLVWPSTIDLKQTIHQGKVIIFRLSPMLGDEASLAVWRFLIASILGVAKQRSTIPPQFRKPCYLIVDEFQNYVNASFWVILAQARKRGLHLIIANQFLGQVTPTRLQQEILANTWIKIIGRNNPNVSTKLLKTMDITPQQFASLLPYQFRVKRWLKKAFTLHSPSTLTLPKRRRHWRPYLISRTKHSQLKKHLIHATGIYTPRKSQEKRASQSRRPKPRFDF
jgi:hypothetical protein